MASPPLSHPSLVIFFGNLDLSLVLLPCKIYVKSKFLPNEMLNRCLWGLLTVLGSDPPPAGLDSWWSRAKARPWVSFFPQSTFSSAGLACRPRRAAGALGHPPYLLPVVPGACFGTGKREITFQELGMIWPYV